MDLRQAPSVMTFKKIPIQIPETENTNALTGYKIKKCYKNKLNNSKLINHRQNMIILLIKKEIPPNRFTQNWTQNSKTNDFKILRILCLII